MGGRAAYLLPEYVAATGAGWVTEKCLYMEKNAWIPWRVGTHPLAPSVTF